MLMFVVSYCLAATHYWVGRWSECTHRNKKRHERSTFRSQISILFYSIFLQIRQIHAQNWPAEEFGERASARKCGREGKISEQHLFVYCLRRRGREESVEIQRTWMIPVTDLIACGVSGCSRFVATRFSAKDWPLLIFSSISDLLF